MPVRVATCLDEAAIERFNDRLAAGGRRERLPRPRGEGDADDGRPRRTVLVAFDRDGEVRAGLQLVHERFFVRGNERWGAWIQLPISEGILDRRHVLAAAQLGRAATRQQPLLMAVGVGGLDEAAARIMIGAGWAHAPVPFVYLPLRPRRIARELRYLRRRRMTWLAARAATSTGIPQLVLAAHRSWVRLMREPVPPSAVVEREFGDWANETYQATRDLIGAGVCRDAVTLNRRYPAADDRFVRIRLRDAGSGSDVGWTVVAPMQMHEHRHFGDLRVGVIVDAFSRAGHEPAVLAAAVGALAEHDVDVVFANWSSERWLNAAATLGLRIGPTNYFAFAAPTADPLLTDLPIEDMHLTRGDSDGMVHLKGTPLRC
jgi:hypothetical protein